MCTRGGCCIISSPMYRIRYSIYTRAYISRHTTAFPSHIELNYSSEFTLCSRHSPEPVSRNRWWTMASFLLPLTHPSSHWATLPSPLSAPVSLNYFIFVFNFILGVSATCAITGRDCVSDTRRWDGDPYKSENDGTGARIPDKCSIQAISPIFLRLAYFMRSGAWKPNSLKKKRSSPFYAHIFLYIRFFRFWTQ